MTQTAPALPVQPTSLPLPGKVDQATFMAVMPHCWSSETCAPDLRATWSIENPAHGHALITCLLAQKYVAAEGEWILVPVLVQHENETADLQDEPDKAGLHVYLRDNKTEAVFDPTGGQFAADTAMEPAGDQVRIENMHKEEAMERYQLLETRFLSHLITAQGEYGVPQAANQSDDDFDPSRPLMLRGPIIPGMMPGELVQEIAAGGAPEGPPREDEPVPTEAPQVDVPDEITPPTPQ